MRCLDRIDDIPAPDWDALFPTDYPFVRHAFLSALERSGSACPETGWQPCHLVLEGVDGTPQAAAPVYLKQHSYGEFVFDFQWADAYQRLGLAYYPKLLCAVPFTPSAGPRLGACNPQQRLALAAALRRLAQTRGCSSSHVLFATDGDVAALSDENYLMRRDVQFRFVNPGYQDFDDYLAALTSVKRKKIRRERRRVCEAGIRFSVVAGDHLNDDEWQRVYALYERTYHIRGQEPYLTQAFWEAYGRAPGTPVRVVLARAGAGTTARIVACALCVESGDTLYGRHWGSEADYHSLHFETCYYQGIAYCIARGLRVFDAGTQGSHKLHRGFEPIATASAHWLAEPRMHRAVERFLTQERDIVARQQAILEGHSAFRRDASPPTSDARYS